ncbi:hypothetical protein A3A46_00670 [Candidatus Roizmanbacteria bacterium RIFCSPLOWO2_01_FULL_37_13]|uniref:Ribosomal subunit interface protein n=1 Tax=Candidatus Roizmanbacteria bacterium RIFCSPHIGHO2_02_FULL_38_11 TaxID=1802039 RepID=A0A1F7H2E2_9BACT|nr:MAG: hypothetical protein A3C25_00360 [Candidatus Roizmanbacteria bacterium RIFCSPHIGHO2_02_FULL_38_11]OGK42913.1 MAG: hypothetical protein A3A46_00670 [Candidatus Roizmanbacteria bacterium RIFCSPLOWO2_01_FULL_37_13]
MTDSNNEIIPVIWKKPHNSSNLFHVGTLNILLDQFIKRYRKRLQIRHIMIDLEMPKDAAGYSDKTFIVKLHLKLIEGRILIAESKKRSIADVMRDITRKIDNQTRSTDRQKHPDSTRKHG